MYRIAKYEDIGEISRLRVLQQKEEWKEQYPKEKDEEFYEITKNYLKEHLNKDMFFFIKTNENKIVAMCGLQIIQYMPLCAIDGVVGHMCGVFTLEEYRRRGIQTRLIEECIEFAKKRNIKNLKLSSNNPEAIKLYKHKGFEFDSNIMKLTLF